MKDNPFPAASFVSITIPEVSIGEDGKTSPFHEWLVNSMDGSMCQGTYGQDIEVLVWRGWVPWFLQWLYIRVQDWPVFRRMKSWFLVRECLLKNAYPIRVSRDDIEGEDVSIQEMELRFE